MVYFVGAGTGAADLITVRGKHLLEQADVIIYAGSLVNPELLAYAKPACEIHNSAKLTLEEVIQLMCDANAKGKTIVRLHTGDPSVYGAVREQMDELDKRKIPYESCPGVSACFGAAASLNLEYTLPGVSQSLIITRMAGRTEVPDKESIESFAAHRASMAIYLSAGMLQELSARLIAGGYEKTTPAALVYKATWKEEEAYLCTLETLSDTGMAHHITKTALVLVGDAIAHQHYQKSRLYASDFTTTFRSRKTEAAFPLQNVGRKLSVISFTQKGKRLSENIKEGLEKEQEVCLYTKCQICGIEETDTDVTFVKTSIIDWAKEQLEEKNALLFLGACGIAVRAIAPFLTDKLHDAPVLVMDEDGGYIIPLLSGHMGGANELAGLIAQKTGAVPVITTATDINRKFAVDLFAKKNGFSIQKKEGIAKISSKVLAGEEITISIEPLRRDDNKADSEESANRLKKEVLSDGIRLVSDLPDEIKLAPYPPSAPVDIVVSSENTPFDAVMVLKPKEYILGVGCKRGKSAEELERFIGETLERLSISKAQIYALSSIAQKSDEQGILTWCRREGIPFFTYSAEELQQVNGTFGTSSFVREQVGVDNVCERAALKACGQGGKLIFPKRAENGMTIAVARREWTVWFDGE
ncbi:MAG: precorrin-4 C(11)-methyltransferase [Muribaculaceae bacterium]|nr:precorrin-4 C(11)-methyltransferase [Muribaculaceae bacterium]